MAATDEELGFDLGDITPAMRRMVFDNRLAGNTKESFRKNVNAALKRMRRGSNAAFDRKVVESDKIIDYLWEQEDPRLPTVH